MKKILFVLSLCLIGFSTQSQEVKKKKSAKATIEVDGICGMCKTRIETAVLKTKGIKFAVWSVETHQLNVILDERKTDIATIQKNVLAVGHDIILDEENKILATDEAYNSVHDCCRYRDEEIIKDHNGELKKQKKTKNR